MLRHAWITRHLIVRKIFGGEAKARGHATEVGAASQRNSLPKSETGIGWPNR